MSSNALVICKMLQLIAEFASATYQLHKVTYAMGEHNTVIQKSECSPSG